MKVSPAIVATAVQYVATLFSPSIRLTSDACLHISFAAYTYFSVSIAWLANNQEDVRSYKSQTVHTNFASMGSQQRDLQVPILASDEKNGPNGAVFVIILEMVSTSQNDTATIIYDLQLATTSCSPPGKYNK